MREIKFRAWVKHERQMLYRSVWDRNWYATPKNDDKGCHCVRGITPDDRPEMILMQYTGLKDRNGKEIYEGDIVSGVVHYLTDDIAFVVEYNYSGFRLKCLVEKEYIPKGQWIDYPVSGLSPEVIGNIYENPELLEKK